MTSDLLHNKMDLYHHRHDLRDRLHSLRRSVCIRCLHSRTSYCGLGQCGDESRRNPHLRGLAPSAETSSVPRDHRCKFWPCFYCWTSTWRFLHIEGQLALVLLDQPACRRTGDLSVTAGLAIKTTTQEACWEGFKQCIKQFDPAGTALLLPGLILLLLALQWGSNQYSWKSTRVVVCLVLGLILLVVFGISQVWASDNGTIPPRILGQRSVAVASVVSLGFGSALTILSFYLPIWYQAIKGFSAIAAGIRLIPYFLVTVFFVIGSGALVSKIGYYTPVLIIGMALVVVGCSLFTTFQVDTSTAKSIGFQVSS